MFDFDLVLVISFNANDMHTSDLIRMLRDDLLPNTSSWCDPYTIKDEILSKLKVLWILDGVEDATRDTEMLMKNLVKNQHKKHTIVMTTKSVYIHTLSTKFPDKTILDITLDGADPMEMLEKFIRSKDSTDYNPEHVNKLKKKLQNLPIDILRELRNPLKMHIILEDLKSENFNPDKNFDLTGLYQRHRERQIKSLVCKHTKGNVSENDAQRKIERWFLVLCQVAYDKVCAGIVLTNYIDTFVLKKLESECDNLGLHSSECLSAFLTHKPKFLPKSSHGYAFYHGTQQYFLAALYIFSVIKDSSDVKSDLIRLFGIPSKYCESIHLYEVLVQLTVLFGVNVDEKTTEALVTVLHHVMPWSNKGQRLFDIIHAVSSNQTMLKHISIMIPNTDWAVNNSQIEDAMNLLQFSTPKTITLHFSKVTPSQFSVALDFLRKLADLPHLVYLRLLLDFPIGDLNSQDTLDPYLEVICQENSQCIVLQLFGHITPDNYGLLKQCMISDYCENLNLFINSPASQQKLSDALETLESIKCLEVALINREINIRTLRSEGGIDEGFRAWLRKEVASHFIIPHKGRKQKKKK